MKKIILFLAVIFLCFGFSDNEKFENSRIEENCCEVRMFDTGIGKILPPGFVLFEHKKHRITEDKISLLYELEAQKDSIYMFSYRFVNVDGLLENTGELFLIDEKNDTIARTMLNGKKYSGVYFTAKNEEKIKYYFNPHENPLLLQKHKKKDKCAKVRCIEYAIGTRMVAKD